MWLNSCHCSEAESNNISSLTKKKQRIYIDVEIFFRSFPQKMPLGKRTLTTAIKLELNPEYKD
jgi:hypothetical protein